MFLKKMRLAAKPRTIVSLAGEEMKKDVTTNLQLNLSRTVDLLRQKNHCLEKYYWINETEMVKMKVGDFDSIEEFYFARNRILEAINLLDDELAKLTQQQSHAVPSLGTAAEVEAILQAKDELVRSILDQDMQILGLVDREKSEIIRELKSTQTTKKAVGAYAQSERMKQLERED